jgi:hypothetical protein
MEIIIHTFIFIHSILYFTKILFELSLGISRLTNFLEIGNLCFMFIFVVTKYVEILLKAKQEIDFTDSKTFQSFSIFVSLEEMNSISLVL